MRNLCILYNVIFFLVGNTLFDNIHHLSDHHHEESKHEHSHECLECLCYDNNQNIILGTIC